MVVSVVGTASDAAHRLWMELLSAQQRWSGRKQLNKVGAVGLQDWYKERKRKGERRGAEARNKGTQGWDREERMHQGWCIGVFLLMQSFKGRGTES